MIKCTRVTLLCLPLARLLRQGHGQAIPTVTSVPENAGFQLPNVQGSLTYGITANTGVTSGYEGGNQAAADTSLAGNLAYISNSAVHPLSALVSGGYYFLQGQQGDPFLNLSLSQVLNSRLANLVLADTVAFLPETGTVGLSGLPGQGDLGVTPVQINGNMTQDLLTNYGTRIDNAASATVSHNLTGSLTLSGTGTYSVLRFISGNGYTSNVLTASASVSRRLNALSHLAGSYAYSQFTYPGQTGDSFSTQTFEGIYSRQLNRATSLNLGGGPQLIMRPGVSTQSSVYINSGISFSNRRTNYGVSVVRSTNMGGGVLTGGISTSISGSVSRPVTRRLSGALTAGYAHTTPLAGITQQGTYSTVIFSGQLNRPLTDRLNAYASYSYNLQNSTTLAGSSAAAFTGTIQVFNVGLSYAPKPIRLGHQ